MRVLCKGKNSARGFVPCGAGATLCVDAVVPRLSAAGATSASITYVQTLLTLLGLVCADSLYSATVHAFKQSVFLLQAALYVIASGVTA